MKVFEGDTYCFGQKNIIIRSTCLKIPFQHFLFSTGLFWGKKDKLYSVFIKEKLRFTILLLQ